MKKLRVFIVEDDRDFAESLVDILEDEGCEVVVANSGEEAVSRKGAFDFDFGLIDVKLPGMNGVDCFQHIHHHNPKMKIVMMTAYSVQQLLQQALDEGAAGILQKPFEIDQLTAIMRKARQSPVVLVADDDVDFVDSVQDILVAEGFIVERACTGEEAVEIILNRNIDLLLLDLRMPLLGGLQVYQNLSRLKKTVPTIIITGFAREEASAISMLKSMSISHCLAKPVMPEKLVEIINSMQET